MELTAEHSADLLSLLLQAWKELPFFFLVSGFIISSGDFFEFYFQMKPVA